MQSDDKHPIGHFISPIELSIRDLELICRIVRPYPSPLEPSTLSNAEKSTVNLPSSFFELPTRSSSTMLQQLLEFTSADLDLKHLVWCAYAAHYRTVSKQKVLALLQALDDWKVSNSTTFQMLKVDDSPSDQIDLSYQVLDQLPFPPTCVENLPGEFGLALALYTFYKARLLWALCLLEDPDGKIELETYFHIYQFLQYTKTALTTSHRFASNNATLPCENLRIGFSPLLHLSGRCCPSPSWLRWIIQELHAIGQEGLFHNESFATTLETILFFEENRIRDPNSSVIGKKFVPASSRTIALVIPDIDGRSFEAYYARPREMLNSNGVQFVLSRVARWSVANKGSPPVIQDYDVYQLPFTKEWLLGQPLVQKWLDWNCGSEFDLNQVIQDHITGNRLLLEVGLE